MRVSAR